MSYRRRVTLGEEDRLALLSATAPTDEALRNWGALMSDIRFDEVNDNTHRAMPNIFVNLREAEGVPERDRLRGAFKHAWSKNTRLFYGARDVLASLTQAGVNYRVIKGAAVQAVSGRIGARVMGDIDLLVSAVDVDRVAAIFNSCGFRRGSLQECTGHSSEGHFSALDFNRDDVHIDVHVAEVKHPSLLLRAMLDDKPVMTLTPAGTLPTPSPEMLILHAAFHGSLSSGQTDLMQAALDLSALRSLSDSSNLYDIADSTNTLGALVSLDTELSALGLAGSGVRMSWLDKVKIRARTKGEIALSLASTSTSWAHRIRARRRDSLDLSEIRTRFPRNPLLYASWLQTGKFASTERQVVRLRGGFLPEPHGLWDGRIPAKPFAQEQEGVIGSPVASQALDWRFRIRLNARTDLQWLRFDSAAFDRLDAHVFSNGVPLSRITAGDHQSRVIGLRNTGPLVEISIRPIWRACELCYSGLDDMTVTCQSEAFIG